MRLLVRDIEADGVELPVELLELEPVSVCDFDSALVAVGDVVPDNVSDGVLDLEVESVSESDGVGV